MEKQNKLNKIKVIIKKNKMNGEILDDKVTANGKVYFFVKTETGEKEWFPFHDVEVKK